MTVKVSILDLANREDPYECHDFDRPQEGPDEFLVNEEDQLDDLLIKAKRLADRVMLGKSIATALGEEDTLAEERAMQCFTPQQKRLFDFWCSEYTTMPEGMQWHALGRASEGQDDASDQRPAKRARVQSGTGDQESDQSTHPEWKVKALGELFHLQTEDQGKVCDDDVDTFCQRFPSLIPLLDAVALIIRYRDGTEVDDNLKAVRQEREYEASKKALDALEKHCQRLKGKKTGFFAEVERYSAILRERVRSSKSATSAVDASESATDERSATALEQTNNGQGMLSAHPEPTVTIERIDAASNTSPPHSEKAAYARQSEESHFSLSSLSHKHRLAAIPEETMETTLSESIHGSDDGQEYRGAMQGHPSSPLVDETSTEGHHLSLRPKRHVQWTKNIVYFDEEQDRQSSRQTSPAQTTYTGLDEMHRSTECEATSPPPNEPSDEENEPQESRGFDADDDDMPRLSDLHRRAMSAIHEASNFQDQQQQSPGFDFAAMSRFTETLSVIPSPDESHAPHSDPNATSEQDHLLNNQQQANHLRNGASQYDGYAWMESQSFRQQQHVAPHDENRFPVLTSRPNYFSRFNEVPF